LGVLKTWLPVKTPRRSNAINKKRGAKRVHSKGYYGSWRLRVFDSWWGQKFKVALNPLQRIFETF